MSLVERAGVAGPERPERPERERPGRPPAIGIGRALWLLFALAARRWINRFAPREKGLGSTFARWGRRLRRKPEPVADGKRGATPGKGGVGVALFILIGVMFIGQSWFMSCRFLGQVSDRLEGGTVVGRSTWIYLEGADRELAAIAKRPQDGGLLEASERQRDKVFSDLRHHLLGSSDLGTLEEGERRAKVEERLGQFRQTGLTQFRLSRQQQSSLGGSGLWPASEHTGSLVAVLASCLLWLSLCLVFVNLGSGNQDLGKVEWGMEWLFGFPLSARAMFAAKLAEYTIINPFVWFMAWPLCSAIYHAGGLALPLAVSLALVTTMLLSVTVAAIRLTAETWLRILLPLHQLKNLQAFCTVAGLLMMIGLFWMAFSSVLPDAPMRWAAALPAWLTWTPFTLPARVSLFETAALVILVVYVLSLPWLTVVICARAVRGGVVVAGGAYQGKRRSAGAAVIAPDGGRLRGIIAKDVTLLMRDRNFLVQTLVVPVLIVGMQLVVNPHMLSGIIGNYHHAATFAFMLGAYVLMASAFAVLAIEGPALWMLYTFPRDLARMLLTKTLVWCVCAMLYTAVVLVLAAASNPQLEYSALGDAAVALAGIGIYAFIAAGIGALGTDPQAVEVRRKISPGATYLFMLLASLFAYAIYNPSLWGRVVQLVLSGVLAFALWQTLRDRLPYLLDPVDRPPPQVGFADGMYAVLAFFVLQGVVMLAMMAGQAPLGVAMAVAFVVAGVMASSGMLLSLWRRQVPDLLRAVGLRRSRSDVRGGLIAGFVLGLGAGVVAAGFALLYLRLIDLVPGLRELREQAALAPVDAEVAWWFAVLAVVAAPVCEEFIFRGLVFRGLRRSLPLAWAACFSAAIFACVHSPLAAMPVFVMGLLAALVFEFSGWLVAPMVAHFTYNLAMVVIQLG